MIVLESLPNDILKLIIYPLKDGVFELISKRFNRIIRDIVDDCRWVNIGCITNYPNLTRLTLNNKSKITDDTLSN